ncbi:TetR/AcrR family transcriptional regulator [Corynebacterium timonense]|uniref:TetR/AcrR family transcriptional regulator n=1 Tax=Corynebacterium timonense TaxID=441500 RepID=UPI001E35F607|nr:TetR/AcrR family transcriptional regulator [Corynebacterium timonense]
MYTIFGSKHGLLRKTLEAVCRNAEEGAVTEDAKNLVVVALVEGAPDSQDLRGLTLRAHALCCGGDAHALGRHVLARAHGRAPSSGSHNEEES